MSNTGIDLFVLYKTNTVILFDNKILLTSVNSSQEIVKLEKMLLHYER